MSGHLKTFDDLDAVIQFIDANCRNPYDKNIRCDCSCEAHWCENNGLALNLEKPEEDEIIQKYRD